MIVVALLALMYAVFSAYAAGRAVRAIPLLADLAPPTPSRWPRVSVVVPACNEGTTLEAALASRLGEGYPDAEYVVVDDRSTDETPAIVDRWAATDPRVVAVHVTELPADWLGKVHALHVGVQKATGEWILFSDADVHHEPGTLARVVAYAEAEGLDHVAVLPTFWSSTFALDVFLGTFVRQLATLSRAWQASDPRSRVSVGSGIFALVRRTSLDRAGGLAPLALEVADDVGLGQRLKLSGARQKLLNARGFVSLHYYRSLPEAIAGMEKNAFALLRFSVPRLLGAAAFLAVGELGSSFALALGHGAARFVAGLALVLLAATQGALARWMRRPLLPSLLAPLGALFGMVGAIRSAVMTLARGGVRWRGTLYPLSALRRGMRFELR